MNLTFHCPNCGAPQDLPAHNETILRCPFCHSSVIVPEEIRGQSVGGDVLTHEQAVTVLPDTDRELIRIIQLIKHGEKDQAVHLFRELFDTSRSDAEKTVDDIEHGRLVSLFHTKKKLESLSSDDDERLQLNAYTRKINSPQVRIGLVVIAAFFIFILGFLFLLIPAEGTGGLLSSLGKPAERLTLLHSFGSEGLMQGQFTQANSIAVDLQGNIYVADLTTGRIQQFDAEGNFLHLWDASDEDLLIWDLEVDQNGILYAAAERSILRYDTRSAERLQPIPNPENYFFYDLAVLPDGSLIAVVQNASLVRLNPDGSTQWIVENAVQAHSDESDTRGSLCVDGNNNSYLAGNFVRMLFKFSPKGEYLNRWGAAGEEPGQLDTIYAVAMNTQGQVVVDDWGKLVIFDDEGRFIEEIETGKTLVDIAYDTSGKLYAIENQNQVLIYQINTP